MNTLTAWDMLIVWQHGTPCSQLSVCKDFRQISLLFHLGKLAEQVVNNKLRGVLLGLLMQFYNF